MAFPYTVYGKYGWEKDITSGQKHKLGTRMELPDGRIYRYSEIGGSDIAAGAVVQAAAGVAAHDQDLVVSAASAGATSVTLSGSLTITKDQYKDGYMHINSGTGRAGQVYRIKSNTAVSSATGCVLTLDEEDGLETALTAGSGNTEVGLAVNTYSNVIISPTTVTNVAIGVAPAILTSDYYGWIQTWGPASVLANAAGVIGEHVRVGGASTAGGTEDLDRDGTNEDEQVIGVQMLIASAAADYAFVFLQISP
tara:strand:+ start:8096 stop:8851 length:756 start_codon:yes stop_codon:yes gene_type:complete